MTEDPPLIQTQQGLADLCAALASAEFVAIDTEFVRERTYYPGLCLVQLATDELLALVDARAELDLGVLLDALARPDLVKVLHSARQDLEIFFILAGAVPGPVFDSQVAAACLGYGDQLSYARLANELLGIDLGKSHARTDWARRPLAPEQLKYAADDVRYLVTMYHRLSAELAEKNRKHWLEDAFGKLIDPTLYMPQPELSYKRIRGTRRLRARAKARLVGLAAWRERLAMQMNRPRRWVVGDETLVALAASEAASAADLRGIPGLPARLHSEQGETILALLQDDGSDGGFEERAAPPTAAENKLIKQLSVTVREEAERLGTSPALLATRDDLIALARNEGDEPPVLRGWRREVIGEKLLAIKSAATA